MPLIDTKTRIEDGNGKGGLILPVPGNKLRDYLRRKLRCDRVEIGSPLHEYGEEDNTASWEDVRKLVAGIQWLVKTWIPYGMLTGIIAEPKIGKSAFVLGGLVRPIITGCNWFNGLPGPKPGNVLWCDTEGSAAINVQRALDWGLPIDRIKVPFPEDPLRIIDLCNTDHLDRIESVICHYKCREMVVDSMRGAHGEDENSSRIARILQSLTTVSERTKASVVIVHHTRKMFEGEELTANSGRGSNAFLAMVRCQIAVDRPDPKSKWCRVRVLGENLGNAPQPIGFRITEQGLEFGPAPEKPSKAPAKDDAKKWLEANMKPGEWHKAAELQDSAEDDGFSETALRRARNELGIVKPNHVRKTSDGWEWKLPGPRKVFKQDAA